MSLALDVNPSNLNHIMEFDHVIIVHEDGTVTDAPQARDYWAPELHEGQLHQLQDGPWSLMDGYTGQQGGGDTMHNSEFIGGRMAEDILSTPGVYVAVICYWDPDEDEDPEDGPFIEGWGVARRDLP